MSHRGPTPTARAAIATALLFGVLLAVAAPALAAGGDIPRLPTPLTDDANALTPADEARISSALADFRAATGDQLFVLFTDTTGSRNAPDFTQQAAIENSLGGNDALLMVAVSDRSDALWVGDFLIEVTDREIDSVLADALEPRLAAGDFPGAAIGASRALADALSVGGATTLPVTPAPAATPTAAPAASGGSTPNPGGTASGSGGATGAFIGLLLVLVGGFFVVRALLRRRATAAATAAKGAVLNVDANRDLLAADEALKDAANDVEFAAAQWGDAEVVPYRAAIAKAGDEVRAAFALRRQLDDAVPEPPDERARLLNEIITRTTAANALLDEQEAKFDQLADLERQAPELLTAASASIDALGPRLTQATATVSRLGETYAPAALASVTGNVAEAEKALASAADETAKGQGVVATSRTEAVQALRRAQDGLAKATHLVEAVERLGVQLDDSAAKLPAELAAAAADLDTARAAVARLATAPQMGRAPATVTGSDGPSNVPDDADPAMALRAAEQALDAARRSAATTPLDPLDALARATAANLAADKVVADVREVQAQAKRRIDMAASAIAGARSHVTRTMDYITTRRHVVSAEPRRRAAEAELHLAEAQRFQGSEPERAASEANQAISMADDAYRLAAAEFDGWNANQPGQPGGSSGANVAGAVLGGVIGAILTGGGPGWGGSSWGGPPTHGGGFGTFGGSSGGGMSGGGRVGGGGGWGSMGGGGGGGGGRVSGGRW